MTLAIIFVGTVVNGFGINSARAQDARIDRPSVASQGEDVATGGVHPLQHIRSIMADVQGRLHDKDTSQETLALQKSIIVELSRMIDKQSQSTSQQSAAGSQIGQPRLGTGKRPRSSNGLGTSPSSGGGPGNMDLMFQRIWGHLPDQVRQQVETPLHEKFLPQYDNLIQDYFKRLANEDP